MRTTITIDDSVYINARKEAFDTGRSIGEVISEWAKKGLQNMAANIRPKQKSGFNFPSFGESGNKNGITAEDVKHAMDEEGIWTAIC